MRVHTSQNQSWPWLNMTKCLSLFKAHEVIPCIPVCPNHSTILKHTPIRFPSIPWPPLLFCKDLSSVIVGKITLIDIIIPSSPKFSWKEVNYRYVATYRLVMYLLMSLNVPGIALLYSSTSAFCFCWLSTTVISPFSLLHSKCESSLVLSSGKIVSLGFGSWQTSSILFSIHSIPSSMCHRAVSQLIQLPFARDLEYHGDESKFLLTKKGHGAYLHVVQSLSSLSERALSQ